MHKFRGRNKNITKIKKKNNNLKKKSKNIRKSENQKYGVNGMCLQEMFWEMKLASDNGQFESA